MLLQSLRAAKLFSTLGTFFYYNDACLVQKRAPEWTLKGVIRNEIKEMKSADFVGKYYVLFFYPHDLYREHFHRLALLYAPQKFSPSMKPWKSLKREMPKYWLAPLTRSMRTWHGVDYHWSRGSGLDLPLLSDKLRTLSNQFGILSDSAGVALRYPLLKIMLSFYVGRRLLWTRVASFDTSPSMTLPLEGVWRRRCASCMRCNLPKGMGKCARLIGKRAQRASALILAGPFAWTKSFQRNKAKAA